MWSFSLPKRSRILQFGPELEPPLQQELASDRQKATLRTQTVPSSLLYLQKERDLYRWLSLVIKCLQRF